MSLAAIILGLVAIVVCVLATVVKTLITDDVKGWLPHASRKLVNRAVDLLPPEHRERWREEWQTDLADYMRDERRLAGLHYAVHALRAATAMRKILRPQLEAETAMSADSTNDERPARKDHLRAYVNFAAAAVGQLRGRLQHAGRSSRATIRLDVNTSVLHMRELAQLIALLGREVLALTRSLLLPIRHLTLAFPVVQKGMLRALARLLLVMATALTFINTSSVIFSVAARYVLVAAAVVVVVVLLLCLALSFSDQRR